MKNIKYFKTKFVRCEEVKFAISLKQNFRPVKLRGKKVSNQTLKFVLR